MILSSYHRVKRKQRVLKRKRIQRMRHEANENYVPRILLMNHFYRLEKNLL